MWYNIRKQTGWICVSPEVITVARCLLTQSVMAPLSGPRWEAGHGMPWHLGTRNLFLNTQKKHSFYCWNLKKCLCISMHTYICTVYIHIYIYIFYMSVLQVMSSISGIHRFHAKTFISESRRPGAFHVAKAVLLAGSTVGVELYLQLKRVGIRWHSCRFMSRVKHWSFKERLKQLTPRAQVSPRNLGNMNPYWRASFSKWLKPSAS